VAGRPDVIFHLAAVVSGEAEDDLEKGLVAEGEDPAYVMQQLGHTDPKMTLGLYAKALKSKRRRPHAQGVRAAGRALDPAANGHGTGTSGVELMAEALTTGSRSAAERTRRANQHAVAHIISTRGAGGTGTDLMVGAPSSRSSPSWWSSWGYTAAVSSMGGTWRPSMTGAGEWAPSPAAPPRRFPVVLAPPGPSLRARFSKSPAQGAAWRVNPNTRPAPSGGIFNGLGGAANAPIGGLPASARRPMEREI
jgi:hypothetical protein